MKLCVILFFLLFKSASITAQNYIYRVSLIADSIKENANCVIRNYQRTIELKPGNKSEERIHNVMTIMNKNGLMEASLRVTYDKNSEVEIKSVTIIDKKGVFVRKVKSSEIFDFPAYQNFILYSDMRMKLYIPEYAEYPFTVEYFYVVKSKNIISYSYWSPVSDFNVSTEYASFELSYNKDDKLKIKELNVPESIVKANQGRVTKFWVIKNIKAIDNEPLSPDFIERVPRVYVMPELLIYDSYSGKAGNWNDYGKWVNELYKNRDELTDEIKNKINSLISNKDDTLLRIKKLYDLMQKNTRYVAVVLGIGGFQPMDAKSVCTSGYGDCKALTNFMHSMLKYIGIKSYPTLVAAGRYQVGIFKDFPNFNQFNHVILCIPLSNDTIWLECTNQKIPFGFLGDFTDDRDVLLITDQGGEFAHTKKYSEQENMKIIKADLILDSLGTALCNLNIIYKGLQYDEIFEFLNANTDDQKKWIYNTISLPSPKLKKYSVSENKDLIPSAQLNEEILSINFSTFSGIYMILPLNQINKIPHIPKMLKVRQSDCIVLRSFTQLDTFLYTIPQNYQVESIPTGVILNTKYGYFENSIAVKGNQIRYTRKLVIYQGRYSANEYSLFFELINSVNKADNAKVMLKNKGYHF